MIDPLAPPSTVLIKLGCAIMHADEALSANAHPLDVIAFRTLLEDPAVVEWIQAMNALAFLPVKR